MQKVSLALTHFNRFELLKECVAGVLSDPRIDEIVISDDASTDGSFDQLKEYYRDDGRVKLFRNKKNLDCYANKRQAVELCQNEWVILFDSDNIMTTAYLDVLWELERWNPQTLYCPTRAQPHFDYREFSGRQVSRETVAHFMTRPHFATALNTANYLVPRDGYLKTWDASVNPHTADSIYMAYRWLQRGGCLFFVDGLEYHHRVHPGSHYKQNHQKTGDFAKTIESRLKAF